MLVPYSMVLLGFFIFWNVSVGRSDAAPMPFRLLGLVLLLVSLFFLTGRFFDDA